jgi:quinol-cytochrome oxidoreductase complex cytochrome b subunit
MSLLRKIISYIDERIGFSNTFLKPIPEYAFNITYWLGAIVVTNFVILIITGVLLAFYYVPTAAPDPAGIPWAYSSTKFIDENVPFGHTIRTLHLYATYGMIGSAFIHLIRQFITGAYKRPREIMWIIGIILGGLVLVQGFTGYLLPYTDQSVYATKVGYNVARSVPLLGDTLAYLVEGIGTQDIIQRFYMLHVFIVPGSILILLLIKMYMFEIHGAFDPHRDIRKSKIRYYKWFPEGFYFIFPISLIYAGILIVFASLFPNRIGEYFDPAKPIPAELPLPEWYFYWMYQIVRISYPPEIVNLIRSFGIADVATFITILVVTIAALYLIFVPFIDRRKEVAISKRFLHVTIGSIMFAEVILLSFFVFLFQIGAISLATSTSFFLTIVSSIILAVIIAGILYVLYKKRGWL